MSHPLRFASWLANGIASALDALFLTHFESQRAKYWEILYSTTSMRVSYLILGSEHDLAPYQTICNFVHRLQDLGGDVKLVTWKGSPHVGHYNHYPDDDGAVVTELLGKAAALHSHRVHQVEGSKVVFDENSDEISDPIFAFRKEGSSGGSHGLGLYLSDLIILSSSVEYYDEKAIRSIYDEHRMGVVRVPSLPSISAHGLLGQILFDVCIPKNVEDWDIRQLSDSYYQRPLTKAAWHSPFNPMKCIRRSRL